MSAYVIVDVEITDPSRYEEYKGLAAPTVESHGGRYLARGGAAEALEGKRAPGRVVILEFPSVDDAKAWWNSEAYAPAKAIRNAASNTEMVVVEGV